MTETLTPNETTSLSIVQEVRKWKEEHAAQYGFDVRKIGKGLQAAQKANPERIVTRADDKAEQAGGDQPATRAEVDE